MSIEHHRLFVPKDDLPEDFFMIIYGMRRCGKSTTLKHMLFEMKDRIKNYRVYLFSSTAKVDPLQYDYFPKNARFHDLEMLDDELGNIMDEQEDRLDVDPDKREVEVDNNKILIVLDDCVNENTIRHSEMLNGLAVHGRHSGMSVIILSQSVCGSASVPPIIRTNADCIMLCTLPRSNNERDLIIKNYLTVEGSKGSKGKVQGMALMESMTNVKYRCMVIGMWDSSARRTKDYVYMYGPVPNPPGEKGFKVGIPEQWGGENEMKKKDGDFNDNLQTTEELKRSNVSKLDDDKKSKNAETGNSKEDGTADDYHAGNDRKSKGTEETSISQRNYIEQGLYYNKKPNTDYLPPALGGSNNNITLRNFSGYSLQGTSNVQSAELEYTLDPTVINGHRYPEKNVKYNVTRLSGWAANRPRFSEDNRPNEYNKQLTPAIHRQLAAWTRLMKKRKRKTKYDNDNPEEIGYNILPPGLESRYNPRFV